ncbi:hypothetical protein ACSSS7_008061 [Eimeria intestinalis]
MRLVAEASEKANKEERIPRIGGRVEGFFLNESERIVSACSNQQEQPADSLQTLQQDVASIGLQHEAISECLGWSAVAAADQGGETPAAAATTAAAAGRQALVDTENPTKRRSREIMLVIAAFSVKIGCLPGTS